MAGSQKARCKGADLRKKENDHPSSWWDREWHNGTYVSRSLAHSMGTAVAAGGLTLNASGYALGWVGRLINALRAYLQRQWLRSRHTYQTFSEFLKDLEDGRLAQVMLGSEYLEAVPTNGTVYRAKLIPYMDRQWLVELLTQKRVIFGALKSSVARRIVTLFFAALPFLYLALVWRVFKKMYNPSDSVAKQHVKPRARRRRVTFADVAGVDTAKAELAEIVDFLRDRRRYVAIGARLPRGVLLSGPSGTGKTLLARAVASEAGVPFYIANASEFVEMLVGRGAARVRDLFQRAAAHPSCIIFIDELDALAKARGGLTSNDEREQTLNQLLTEMDGFDTAENSIVVVGATNRPEVLDPALTRPGRFDRHVVVPLPDTRGRRAILEVHVRGIRVGQDVDLQRLAMQCRGFSGADIASLVNEAAFLSVRSGQTLVTMRAMEAALERAKQAKALVAGLYCRGTRE